MRYLIVGAGATGGYFGGRLVEKAEDVTFLVRKMRKNQLKDKGLVIKSIHGDFQANVKTIIAGEESEPYDVIILSVKAYHLEQAILDISPYVGENTMIIPLLNGYNHYETLQHTFGRENILGGLCFIETTINEQGEIVQTSKKHDFIFGEWNGLHTKRVQQINDRLQGARFTAILSENIQEDIWNKYIFIATMSGVTTLMRSPIGPILADRNSKEVCKSLLNEIVTIAKMTFDHPNQDELASLTLQKLEACEPSMKSSMQRDMEKKVPVEADHFHGALLKIAEKEGKIENNFLILKTVYSNLKIYEQLL